MGHAVPTMRSLCAQLCLQAALAFNLWAHSRAIMRLLCAHDAPALSFNRFGVRSKGPQRGHSVPTLCSLRAHYAFKPLWG